jgi:SAM-dependent methyltransferase
MRPSASADALLTLGAKRSARLRRRFVGQFHRPSGLLGRLVGRIMATRSSNVERNRWAVDQLALRPTDRVLEIGFGPGVALEALVARVTAGAVHGIDHSDVMVRMATRRNARAVAEGRLRLSRAGVADVDEALAPLAPLDLILAVNNMGMWPDPPAQLSHLAGLLAPGGRIAIGQQPRTPDADADIARRAADEITGLLTGAGLGDVETRQLDLDPPMVLVVGTRVG